jgi:glutamate racemase
MKNSPIGVFDSGIGGLSVLSELVKLLPNEEYIYLGDTARVPWGNKSISTIKEYSRECTEFLMDKDVKMIVVACNTASSLGIDSVQHAAGKIPVVEMILPAAEAAYKSSVNGKIGVIGTKATVRSNAYQNAIAKYNTFDNLKVFQQACPLFVPIVEEAMIKHPAAKLIAEDYLSVFKDSNIDTLLLACTHYPFMSELIAEILPNIRLIDTGNAASRQVFNILKENDWLHDQIKDKLSIELYCTDTPSDFLSTARTYLSFELPQAKKADIC